MADVKQSRVEVGSVVRLKSGGPLMTAVYYLEKPPPNWGSIPCWRCQWFDEGEVKTWAGPTAALEVVSGPEVQGG